jgi:hypothetical protein
MKPLVTLHQAGTARCAVRAAFSGANGKCSAVSESPWFRPLLRGRGHRSAISLPLKPEVQP